MKPELISREAIVTEIKRVIRWAIECKLEEASYQTEENKRLCRVRRYSYLLCAWNMGRMLR